MNFSISNGKGFYMGFPNGWGVSVDFGPGNYADNYDMFSRDTEEAGQAGSDTAECAVITPEKKRFHHPGFGGDSVKGYCTPNEVLELLKWASEQHGE